MICKFCGEDKWIPAGVSKRTGKPYEAFCSNEECVTKSLKKEPGITKIAVSNQPTKPANGELGMYKCNALNNATALMSEAMKMGANFSKEDLDLYYNDCLSILIK